MHFVLVFVPFLFLFPLASNGEVTDGTSSVEEHAPLYRCSAKQRTENIEIIKYCNSKWTDWGVIPKPSTEELRSADDCYDSSKDYWVNVYNNCPEGLLALPIMIGQLAIYGMAMSHSPDKQSPRYILMNGNKKEIAGMYTEEIIRRYCKGLANDRDYRLLKEKLCPHRETVLNGCPEEKQRLWEKRVQEARICKREFRKKWRSAPSLRSEVSSRTKKIMEERAKQERLKQRHNSRIASIKSKCGPIINPYRDSILKYIFPGIQYAQDAKNYTFPNRDIMVRYNACIKKETAGDEELVNNLMKGTGSILQSIYGDLYDAIKCFEPQKRMKLYCELAGGFVGAGVTTVAGFALKKSARRQFEQAMIDHDLNDLSDNALDVIKARRLPAVTQTKIKNALNTLTKEELEYLSKNPDEIFGKVRVCGK